jgi:hypothetical protein
VFVHTLQFQISYFAIYYALISAISTAQEEENTGSGIIQITTIRHQRVPFAKQLNYEKEGEIA